MALLNMERARLLRDLMKGIPGVKVVDAPFFNEFTVELPMPAREFVSRMFDRGFAAGLPASLFYPNRDTQLILCATEKRSEPEIRSFVAAASEVLR